MLLLEPEEIQIEGKTYIISSLPAILGREVITQYPLSAMPGKIGGDYKINEELMLKLMSRVAVVLEDGEQLILANRALIDNHVPSFEVLMKLEWAMLQKSCSFFRDGNLSGLVERLTERLPALISKTLTASMQHSSEKGSAPSKS